MNDDFLDLLFELSDAEARFLIVGGYAVGAHGYPRATKDLDVWVEASPDNATRVIAALEAFNAPIGDLGAADLATPGVGFMMGRPPRRIDILTKIAGLEFERAWPRRVTMTFGHAAYPVISISDLILNKRAAGRAQDLADAEVLEKIRDGLS
ncbi:hypothetical protein [Enhygromyxa salina]|uniref:hypothetical protein n=1 Tax=Enhygromyxa salina TaxID=215803 RepID=UPI001FD22A0E|nr:hypothetical protein [Enhygromyxa salina]